jgi:predicted lipoprotein with Yx(FWY)xxD motif
MSLPSSWRAGAAALLLAAPLTLSACGTSNNGVPASLAAPVGNGSPIAGASTIDAGRDSISTAATFIGTVMTSGGFTLYRNTKDRTAPPASTCTGQCASTWPPVAADAQPTLDGVDATLIGTALRPDGSKQLTVAGWPVYRYVKDMLPGTVNGQGVDGVWEAIGVDGKPTASPARATVPPVRPPKAPAKPAPTKAPAAAPKVVAPPTKAPAAAPKVAPKPPVAPTKTVVRDAPGTSSTD